MDFFAQLTAQITQLPRKGTPVANLTERDRLALCISAGAPIETEVVDGFLNVKTAVPCGIADRGDGGYIVAVQRPSGRTILDL